MPEMTGIRKNFERTAIMEQMMSPMPQRQKRGMKRSRYTPFSKTSQRINTQSPKMADQKKRAWAA